MLDFSKLFHQNSKNHGAGRTRNVSSNSDEWPVEWKTTYYKTYPRMDTLPLIDTPPAVDLFDTIRARSSRRDFSRAPIRVENLSHILKYSCGIVRTEPAVKRAQPSGGARFPLEVYPLVFAGSPEVPAGLYHYNLKKHSLDVLWKRPFLDAEIGELFTYPWMQKASAVIVITAVFERNQMKYGERGYRYALMEAGHIGQNMYLTSEALGVQCCALGGTQDTNLEKLLDIDGTTESVVYALALG